MSKYIESYVTSARPQVQNVESSRVSDLIPEQQRDNADVLIRLLEDYYRHLNTKGLPSNVVESITTEQDIDLASSEFIDEIQKEIAKTFPDSLSFNKVSFYKRIVDYYSSRGTENSALTFFKLFFDESIQIFYPKDNLFRLSEGDWRPSGNTDRLSTVTGFTTNGYELSNANIGTRLDFFNRPQLSHDTVFQIHAADGDSAIPGTGTWNDISGLGHDALLRGGLENNYLLSEKAYEFNNGTTGNYAVISNLNYGAGKTIAEMSCFVWMRTDYDSGTTDGALNTTNWALIDFDRSEVFNLFINGDGFLSFAGNPSNNGGIGTNMTGGTSSLFDIAANGRAAGDTVGAVDTSLKVNDGDYHYVGVTYSVANQRIILWIDGVAKFVATGNGSLTALATGGDQLKRFGVIGDGSEASTNTDINNYNSPGLNNIWFDGAISAIHLHEVEVCSDDVSIAVDDTNTNVTANKNATTVSTYPEKQYGVLSSIDLISQSSTSTIDANITYGEGQLDDSQSLDGSLKLYYDLGIQESYVPGTSIVNDISDYGTIDADIICDHCTHTSNSLVYNPSQAVNPITNGDSIFAQGLNQQLGLASAGGTPQHTFVTWIKKDNFVSKNNSDQFVGYSYSAIFSYRTPKSEEAQYLLIRHEDGALGRFMPIPSNQFGTYIAGNNNTTYARYPATGAPFIHGFIGQENNMFSEDYQAFSTTNKITDNEWHMVALRADASGNGTIDISVDGGTWENIYTGSDSVNADTFNFEDVSATQRYLSIGSSRASSGAATAFGFRTFGVPEDVSINSTSSSVQTTALPFSGEINSFYAYDKELSQSEITSLYNTTQSVVTNSVVLGQDQFLYEIGYTEVEHSNVSSNTQYVEFDYLPGSPKLVNLSFSEKANAVQGGLYKNKRGFISNINKLQDSNYWQDFSYEIQSGITSSSWINEFNNLVHPAGMKLFAALVLKIVKQNKWDDHYINQLYQLKRFIATEQNTESAEEDLRLLEEEINSLYRLSGDDVDYRSDFSWIRDPQLDSYNPDAYGVPTFQPGYLYKEFTLLTFIVEAFLTPTDNPVTSEEQYWINIGKNYFAHIILAYLVESSENINDRMYSQYALGQLKFIAESGPMSQYKDYRLDQGAIEDSLNIEKDLKFTGLSALVTATGVGSIYPYLRGYLDGTASSTPSSNNNYDLSSYEADGDGTTYDNSSIDQDITDIGTL